MTLKEFVTDIANAIRSKEGTHELIACEDMEQRIRKLPSGGEDIIEKMNSGEAISYVNHTITALRSYLFYNNTLKNIDAQNIATIEEYALYGTLIETADFPRCTSVGRNAFSGCEYLKNINLPLVTTVSQNMLSGCTSLVNLYLQSITYLDFQPFAGCSSLAKISFPKLSRVRTTATFTGCADLEVVDMGEIGTIVASTFSASSKLRVLILRRKDTITSLASTNAFHADSPIAQGIGTIYISEELISDYQAGTNWSALPSQFLPLEGSSYENPNWLESEALV